VVLYGSSADDQVYCLDAATGREKWSFFTEGPVRFAPTVAAGKVYVGSDDGRVYCLALGDSKLLWRRRVASDDRRVPGNGRVISVWPVRTGVLVDRGVVYCCAGLFCREGLHLCALDAKEGTVLWRREVGGSRPPQGYLMASDSRLFVPTGRTPPIVFDRRDGKNLGAIDGQGGTFALVDDDIVVSGPGRQTGHVDLSDSQTRQRIATFRGLRMIVHEGRAYLHTKRSIAALNRVEHVRLARKKHALVAQRNRLNKRLAAAKKQGPSEEAKAVGAELNETNRQISAAVEGMEKCFLWRQSCSCPYSLILAGDTLFAGGEDRVVAFGAADGKELWNAGVEGRAYAIAAAEGRLLVSTDRGAIHCFSQDRGVSVDQARPPEERSERSPADARAPVGQQADREDGLLGRWVFDHAHLLGRHVQDLAGSNQATITGPPRLRSDPPGLVLGGSEVGVSLSESIRAADGSSLLASLPTKDLSAEAWVAIDTPIDWAGIISAVQDNGSFEKGWVLCTRKERFAFAVSTVGADDGNGRLTYLESTVSYKPGVLYHVVGTYDGAEMRIYVNGALAGSTRAQSGNINYPPQAFYDIGSFHDDNDRVGLIGSIAEVRVYGRTLRESEVRAHFAAPPTPAPVPPTATFRAGPYVRHHSGDEVLIVWETEEPTTAVLEYADTTASVERIEDPASAKTHRVQLRDLRPDQDYSFRIVSMGRDGVRKISEWLTFDSASDLSPVARPGSGSPYPKDGLTEVYARAAREIAERSGVKKGYCVDLGCGTGRLAYEIAKLTDLRIIGVEEDPKRAARARAALDKAGLYGVRVSVHCGSAAALPYAGSFANLIVSDRTLVSGKLPGRRGEVSRVLRPYGGVACLGGPRLGPAEAETWLNRAEEHQWRIETRGGPWIVARRGPVPGGGEWTHQYADAGNTASSGDTLRAPLRIQWFGRPGPRSINDRHHRAPGPLWAGGRLFVPGDNRVLAVDPYNGTVLWETDVPSSRRVGTPKDCGHAVATDDFVYLAADDKCVGMDVETGEPRLTFDAPQLASGARRHWGYLASAGDLLFGSGQKQEASRTRFGKEIVKTGIYYDHKPLVTSDYLFCLDRHTGAQLWTYRAPGGSAFVNPAIAVGGGHVYFIESRNPAAVSDGDGRITLDVLLAEGHAYLVKLGQRDGRKAWERPLELSVLRHAVFLTYARGLLLVVGSRNEGGHPRYDLHGFRAADGERVWSSHYLRTDKKVGGSHGEQDQHPVVIGDVVYSRPYAFSLKTGEEQAFELGRGGHGCGALSASAFFLYGRGGTPRMYPISDGGSKNIALTHVTRVGCWVNIIPAGGLVLIPESSSGCVCAYPLQTSLALAPAVPVP